MGAPSPRMTEDEFSSVRESCGRWSDRSLKAMYDYFVRGLTPSEVATAHNILAQNVVTLRKRFLSKAQASRLARFIDNEKPVADLIRDYLPDLRTLRDKGYTPEQMTKYLEQQGVTVTPSELTLFMETPRA